MAKTNLKKPTIDINDEREIRLRKLAELVSAGISPYPSSSERADYIVTAAAKKAGTKTQIAGRLMSKRAMGKLTFGHLQDESGRIQIVLRADQVKDPLYQRFGNQIDIGDILTVTGERFVTKKGEESVLVHTWNILAKAVRPLPDKFHGLKDEELRLRKRYLDLLLDGEARALFRRKARFWQSTREFLIGEGFLEVETPVLEVTSGGADANPFVTRHDALDLDVYLRISNGELWQKRLMVAGFEKTFEIGRQFRNEGISREHLQDYTQMEFYWAYADYRDGMTLARRLYQHVIHETFGKLKFDIGQFTNVDLSGEWPMISYAETIKKMTGVDVLGAGDKALKLKLQDLNVPYERDAAGGRLMDALWKHCRKEIKGPVFLIDLPVAVSPLAKRKADNSALTERYQIILAGTEVGNGYSELNDPLDQAERFAEQQAQRAAGDREAQMFDHDFVEALEYGMPPTTGFGVSERLFSVLEDKPIRECVLFPLVKPAP